jgi:hypothetical protein
MRVVNRLWSQVRVWGLPVAAALMMMVALPTEARAQWENMGEGDLQRSAEQFRGKSVCQDFWIDFATSMISAGTRRPEGNDCNIQNYNRGQWNSLKELIAFASCRSQMRVPCHKVVLTYSAGFSELNGKRVGVVTTLADGNRLGAFYYDANGRVLTGDNYTLVAAGGGNMVAAGGGNMVAAGGGNLVDTMQLVGNDGASMVAAGAGNLVRQGMASLASGPGQYRLQHVGDTIAGFGIFAPGATRRGETKPLNMHMDILNPTAPKGGGQ